MLIYTDVRLAKQRRSHACVLHNEQDHRWFNSMVECLQYADDLGHTEVTVSDDHGSVKLLIVSKGDPIP